MPPVKPTARKRSKLQAVGEGGLLILQALNSTSDVFPPLKAATGGALHIVNQVKAR
jgi:hypothetical protein